MPDHWTRRAFLGSAAASAALASRALATTLPDTGLEDTGLGDTGLGDTGIHTGLPADTAVARGPNIVLIFPDQWNGAHLGGLGHPMVQTPTVDRLMANSVTFTRCHTMSPLCQPSRLSFTTRLLPSETGVDKNGQAIDATLPSHVRRMRDEAGYHTHVVGKVHLHNQRGHTSQHVGILEDWGYETSSEIYGMAITSQGNESPYTDWLHGFANGNTDPRQLFLDHLDQWMASHHRDAEWSTPSVSTFGMPDGFTPDAWIGQTAADWIRAHPQDRPFYLQVNFTGPHPPWNAPDASQAIFDPNDPALLLPNLQDPGLPHSFLIDKLRQEYTFPPTEADVRQMMVKYYANMHHVDRAIAAIEQALHDAGLTGDTWIIFASDHGEQMGEKNLMTKLTFFEQSTHVPLIVRPPGGTAAWQSAALCDLFDVAATVLAIGGLDPTTDGRGESLLDKVLEGETGAGAQTHHTELVGQVWDHSMIRNDEHKLVIDDTTGDHVEYYDLVNDPAELVNQVDEPATQATRDDLELLLQACIA